MAIKRSTLPQGLEKMPHKMDFSTTMQLSFPTTAADLKKGECSSKKLSECRLDETRS